MFASLLRPSNLSEKMIRVIFSIYLAVTFIITSVQFVTEYLKTKDSIVTELQQLEETVLGPISTSLWQYDQYQIEVLTAGLVQTPIVEGIDIVDQDARTLISERSYSSGSTPLSIFNTKSDLSWELNGEEIHLGSVTLYSSSEVVLNRVLFGFALIAITAIIKITILFSLFVWAFDRYMARPFKELMSQVEDVQHSQNMSKRIKLSNIENTELNQLQEHINNMLASIERSREQLLEREEIKRNSLEDAVTERTEELQILNEKLKELATLDSLTGLLNRGSFFETAQHILSLSKRQKSPASFVLMDLDHFKVINDTHGHFIGDKVLTHFTENVKKLLRESDLFGRVGGEEFALFLPNTGKNNAFNIAEKIRVLIKDSALEIDGVTIRYTVSLGIESSEDNSYSITELYKRADLKLYGAKGKGRNNVER